MTLTVLVLLAASAEAVDAARLEAGSTTQLRSLGTGLHHVWVPAGMLGDLAAVEAMRPGLAEHLEKTLQLFHGGNCLGHVNETPPTLPNGLAEAVDAARAVLIGTVADGMPGFFGTTPGTLYRVSRLESVENATVVRDSGLLFVPGGGFSVGETTVCFKGNALPKHRPELGKRVLLLLSTDWSGDEEIIPINPFEGLLTERVDGAYHAPRNHYLRTAIEVGIESFDELVLRLREREESP